MYAYTHAYTLNYIYAQVRRATNPLLSANGIMDLEGLKEYFDKKFESLANKSKSVSVKPLALKNKGNQSQAVGKGKVLTMDFIPFLHSESASSETSDRKQRKTHRWNR